jgi:hypothetical protein
MPGREPTRATDPPVRQRTQLRTAPNGNTFFNDGSLRNRSKVDNGARRPEWPIAVTLKSDINRPYLHRLLPVFSEVYGETGSLRQSICHTARFTGKKLVPLARYGCFTLIRSVVTRRLRTSNASIAPNVPVIGLRLLGRIGDYIVIARLCP